MNKEKVKRTLRKIIKESEYDELSKVTFLVYVCNIVFNNGYCIDDKLRNYKWDDWHEDEMWEKIVSLYDENKIEPYSDDRYSFYFALTDLYSFVSDKYHKNYDKTFYYG